MTQAKKEPAVAAVNSGFIKNAIEDDNDLKFRAYFSQVSVVENYNFLKASYVAMQSTPADLRSHLEGLKTQFILEGSPEEINISHSTRQNFLTNFDSYLEGECDDDKILGILGNIVRAIHSSVYGNLILLEGFESHLKRYEPQINDSPSVSNSKHCCTLF